MKRWALVILLLIVAGVAVLWVGNPLERVRAPIRVGLLHSLTGPMSISEKSMVDAEKLAIDEVNAQGGLLGRRVEWVEADGRSDPATFAREAARLIEDEKVSVIVGCWTSASRKAIKPVVERANHLLIFPVAYEGLEQSPNIIYTGAAPNQQIIPTVKWCRDFFKAKSFYLIGSDTFWPRAVNAIIQDQLKAFGVTLAGESYIEFGSSDVGPAITKALAAKPDVILSTIEGDTNLAFYKKLRGAETASKIPVVSFSMAEDELRQLPVGEMKYDYCVCNYFQSLDRPKNVDFVRRFKAKYGRDRVTSDAIDTAYNSIHLWAGAVRESDSSDVNKVRETLLHMSVNAPEGVVSIDKMSNHTWRPFFVGRVLGDGQIEVIWSSNKAIRPAPFPYSRTRAEWQSFVEDLLRRTDSPAASRQSRPS